MEKPSCDNCKFALMKDQGYSNYTVEGTEFSCAKHVHPDGIFDRFYGENPKFKYAEECPGYEHGVPIDFDVDGEHEHTEAQKEVIRMSKAWKLIGVK